MKCLKHLFIMAAVAASLCSCSKGSRLVILAAEEAEYNRCREIFPEMECILTGVGAGNIIKTCCNLPKGTRIINIGYAGSNNIEIGTVSLVSDSFRYTDGNYVFDDHANPLHLSDEGISCYTGNSFFTESDRTEPTLYDMELNYIASFSPHLELVAAVKIVSDNLSVDAFLNNAIRESGVLTSDEVWAKVREIILALNL
ncbi:MAG: hypothetical protein MJY46_00480 [Bacteroidales bacterium]|nr:hypothetical protein [Bacteroidales bacterium]